MKRGRKFLGYVALICPQCEINFQRTQRRYNQALKRNRRMYCSISCAGKAGRSKLHSKSPKGTKTLKRRANKYINRLIKNKQIQRPPACSECMALGKVNAHHENYSKPGAVIWLCPSCHMKRHWTTTVGPRLIYER